MTPSNSNPCPNCGQPPGECYHLCFNSPAYYSPEQERADEPFYGDDDIRERYAGEIIDAEYEQACADQADAELAREYERPADLNLPAPIAQLFGGDTNPDDIPF